MKSGETDMATPFWLQTAADDFWQAAGEVEPFPRNLETPVLWALPLYIVKVPRLSLSELRKHLVDYGIGFKIGGSNRHLYGCLVAFAGKGVVMLDGSEPADELRLSLAHEVGHFIIDYAKPRDRAFRRLGPAIVNVLDGLRPLTPEERVDAVLSNVRIGIHTHLMDRTASGAIGCGRISGSEFRADRLAFELLAPEEAVVSAVSSLGVESSATDHLLHIENVLIDVFGLPDMAARQYAHFLSGVGDHRPSIKAWLGIDGDPSTTAESPPPNLSNCPSPARKIVT